MVTVDFDAGLRRGTFVLDTRFTSTGRVTALIGRSGSGKSTVLHAIAGLLRPQRGRIVIAGRVFCDTAAGLWVPPHQRRVGYVFQDLRLFPHLSVLANLRYGQRGTPSMAARFEPDAVMSLLGIGHLQRRGTRDLSGGEAQRVAIGRALLTQPTLLLLDEPLSMLDAQRKAELIPYLQRLRDETALPMLYVSHAHDEVTQLADAEVVLQDARFS